MRSGRDRCGWKWPVVGRNFLCLPRLSNLTKYRNSPLLPNDQAKTKTCPKVTGSTDGGIVLFNAPGTAVVDNTIISSATESGFGAINLVDYLEVYGGSYANVQVSRNTIHGDKLFNAGIAIGGCAWSFGTCNPVLSGPTAIEDNTFSGHISFPIGVNGWTGGLTVRTTHRTFPYQGQHLRILTQP